MILDLVKRVATLTDTRIGRVVTASASKHNQHLVSNGRKRSLDYVIIDVPKPIAKLIGTQQKVGILFGKE